MTEKNQNSIKYYLSPKSTPKKTLVLDLDETLVHSQFVPFSIKSDLVLKIDLENQIHDIHVMIRPGVNEFLKKMGKLYEIVIFTASVSKYADPLLDIIDKNHNCSHRLFREHCSMVGITYIKDLKKLGRDLKDIIIAQNPSVFNRDGSVKTGARIDKLDIPNAKWLKEEFPNTQINVNDSLGKIFDDIYSQTGESFIFILDEWDYIFNNNLFEPEDKEEFLEFLRKLLKDKPYVELAYMTGVLPIAKYSSGSAINMFDEYTFLNDDEFDEYFGFTEKLSMAVWKDFAASL